MKVFVFIKLLNNNYFFNKMSENCSGQWKAVLGKQKSWNTMMHWKILSPNKKLFKKKIWYLVWLGEVSSQHALIYFFYRSCPKQKGTIMTHQNCFVFFVTLSNTFWLLTTSLGPCPVIYSNSLGRFALSSSTDWLTF